MRLSLSPVGNAPTLDFAKALFAYVNEAVGFDNTLIVLSDDHIVPDAPEQVVAIGMQAWQIDFDWFKKLEALFDALERCFGRGDLIANHSHPYLYLELETIDVAGC